jgi:mannose-1-phosphate guanylyltransferase/mannose-6-phosphate isomerase
LSRTERPKQLLKIIGNNSLIDETARRAFRLTDPAHTLVVTIQDQLNAIRKELSKIPRGNFICEPTGRNTAPCIGLAALELISRDPDAIMMVFPADHWVTDVPKFQQTLAAAAQLAAKGAELITIGMKPEYPETGYGYILKGKSLGADRKMTAFKVDRFAEKPSLDDAGSLMDRGALWNSGIFIWKAATILDLLDRYQPEISAALEKIRKAVKRSLTNPAPALKSLIAREYKKMPEIAIDKAVLEPAASDGKVITLEGDFGWSDVGSWAAVHRLLPHDGDHNAGKGQWVALHANNCLIHAPERLVVLLGIQNAVVVDTPDAVLVADLSRSQEVREIVGSLRKKGHAAYTIR